nr:glycosyltransferase [Aliikangiella sp. G2MR2-5]
MEQAKLVSVVLPTQNRAFCIERAVESVLNQTYQNIEVIIIDDGSTDNTAEIVKQWQGKVSYHFEKCDGASKARNVGIKMAKGDYLAFIDSDDFWERDKLRQQVELLEKNPELGLSFTNGVIINENGKEGRKYEVIPHTGDAVFGLKEVLEDPYFGLPTVIVKKEVIGKVGLFDEELKTAEDLDFFMRVALHFKVGYLHNKLVKIYVTEGSLSSDDTSYEDNIKVVTRFVETNKKACLDAGFDVESALSNINYEYAKSLLWMGRNKAARERLIEAFRHKFHLNIAYLFIKSYIR